MPKKINRRQPRRRPRGRQLRAFVRLKGGMPAPKVQLFKRTVMELVDLGVHQVENPSPDPQHNGLYSELLTGTANTSWTVAPQYTLGDVPAHTDFTNLFTQYKICGVAERYFLSQNPATAPPVIAAGTPGATIGALSTTGETNYYNPSILMDSWYNPSVVEAPASTLDVLQIQRRKRRVLNVNGKKMYSKVKQMLQMDNKDASSGYDVLAKSNKWIPCERTDIPHHGQTHWIRASTGTGQMPHITVRIERTYYIACRGVR